MKDSNLVASGRGVDLALTATPEDTVTETSVVTETGVVMDRSFCSIQFIQAIRLNNRRGCRFRQMGTLDNRCLRLICRYPLHADLLARVTADRDWKIRAKTQ